MNTDIGVVAFEYRYVVKKNGKMYGPYWYAEKRFTVHNPHETRVFWVYVGKLMNTQLAVKRLVEKAVNTFGREEGEIDWRPTELMPEDHFTI